MVVAKRERSLVDRLYDVVIDVLLDTGSLISLKILTKEQYAKLGAIPTPFLAR